ncbi:MAG: SusC/RagA family TonB-linked outer membrane protein [Paludibacteraceae bacterium]|nr:SusC/RagA family TonB-linked outer membrane protein [Paludibacteraceae bacterium]
MKKRILFSTLCAFFAIIAVAQTKVTGTILDETGEPAIGANIVAEGTTVGTVSDFDGHFELMVPSEVKNLVISYMGYRTETVAVKPTLKVTLSTDTQQIQEVVVQGMVSQDKRLFTGASTKIEAEENLVSGMTDVSRSLAGRVAGVSMQNVSGTFGSAPKIRIRGATSIYGASKPLWVVDGVVMEDVEELSADDLGSGDANTLIANAIAGLNAEDIESFQVLKDGSATSIYGARAMAGVIVVTTKKAQKGTTKMNYTAELTYRMKPMYYDYNICNSQEQMSIYRELEDKGWLEFTSLSGAKNYGVYGKMYELIDTYNTTDGKFGLPNTPEAKNAYLRQAELRNTDWFDQLFINTVMHSHSFSISSGTDRARIYASLSLMHDPGWYKSSNVMRLTGNVKATFDLSKQVQLTLSTNDSYRRQKAPGTINQNVDPITGKISREFDINPFSYAMNTSRTLDPEETYRRNYCGFNIFDELDANYMDYNILNAKFQAELSIKPVRGLDIRGLVAYRYNNNHIEHNIMDNSNQARAYRAGIDPEDATIRDVNPYLYTDPDNSQAIPETVMPSGGIFHETTKTISQLDVRGTIAYNRDLGKEGHHIISVFGGVEMNIVDRKTTENYDYGYQYDYGGTPYMNYTLFKQMQEEGGTYYDNYVQFSRSLAFFAMGTYSYRGRYTLNGTIRYEGTNKLGKSTRARWLPTWNVSGAWNAHEERWWKPTFRKWWTNFTLKASYSLTADRGPRSADNSLAKFYSEVPWRPLSSVQETTIYLSSLENSELTYEKKHELNITTELGFIDNRINLEFSYYLRNNFDLIGYVNTQGTGGQIRKLANDATMRTNGVELSLKTTNIKKKNFTWTTNFTFSHNNEKITHLNSTSKISSLCSRYGAPMEGYAIHSLFSIPFAGLTDVGLPMFYTNKEHTETTTTGINMQEYENTDFLKYEGTIDPVWEGQFRNTFRFYGVTVDVNLFYSGGNVLRLDNLCYARSSDYSDITASMREMKNRWCVPGDEKYTTIPTIASKRQVNYITNLSRAYQAYNYSTERVAKGDFLRLKDISVGYDLPKKLFQGQKYVSSFGMKLTASNICLLAADKKLNGQDPEFLNAGGVSSPSPRQFTLSLKLGL